MNVPTGQADSPFLVTPDAGEPGTLYANSGIVTERRLSERVGRQVAVAAAPALRKLTHFRAPGMGDPMWSGACVYDLQGQSPSFSVYDDPSIYADDDGLTYSVTAGVVKSGDRLTVGEPTSTRKARVAAVFDSAPAAATFQGYFNPRWSGLLAGFRPQIMPRPLHSNFNPNQMGTKELHKATEYKPVPPMGSIVSYFGSNDKAL